MQSNKGWIGVDLDGTLAEHIDGWPEKPFVGRPIYPMVARVKRWLAAGKEVRILTARVASIMPDREQQLQIVAEWSESVFGQRLVVTAEKDPFMVELWDDRAVEVVRNTGAPRCVYHGYV